MKRNTIFGAAALLVAGAAIGAGSVVSSNAMADTGAPAPTSQLTMISIGADGKAVQCTFSGADAAALLPPMPAGLPADAKPVDGKVVIGQAQIAPTDGSVPGIVASANGQVITGTAIGSGTVIATAGAPGDGPKLTSDGTALSFDNARQGTAEECKAIHDQAAQFAKNATNGGASTVIGSGADVITSTVTATKP